MVMTQLARVTMPMYLRHKEKRMTKLLIYLSVLCITVGSGIFDFSTNTLHGIFTAGLILGIVAIILEYDKNF